MDTCWPGLNSLGAFFAIPLGPHAPQFLSGVYNIHWLYLRNILKRPFVNVVFLGCGGDRRKCVLAVSTQYEECLDIDLFEVLFLFDEAYRDGEFALGAIKQ